MKLLENPFGIHEKALAVRNQRMELISANIANADTPLFRAKDLDFKKVLSNTNPSPMAATNARHFDTGESENMSATQYQATLQFLESRISGIRKSLRGE